mmetsp:Transcript_57615/g.161617  ORF Transcript_57615/g.161617 Transcript_57615/m.161617 type:complete len:351 (-) Transcript_57615:180-1232(-)
MRASSSSQVPKVHHEFSRDQLSVMLLQEEKFYQCEDFLSIHELEPMMKDSPLHNIVAECAMIVTDVRPPISTPKSPSWAQSGNSNRLIHSPTTVNRFPPSTSHIEGSSTGTRMGQCVIPSSSQSNMSSADRTPLHAMEAACLLGWRREMLAWAYSVTDTYHLDREVVAATFHLLDRYIASEVLCTPDYAEAPINREDFQLYAMVCMYIAIKAFVPIRKMTVGCIIEMSRDFYTEQHIVEAEMEILGALGWHVNKPTVMDFCRLYWDLFPIASNEEMTQASCQYLAELALADGYFISKPTSLVALATVLLASQRLGVSLQDTEGFLENLQGLVSVKASDFDALSRRLENLC